MSCCLYSDLSCDHFLSSFCVAGDQTLSLGHSRQAFDHHAASVTNSFFFLYILRRVLVIDPSDPCTPKKTQLKILTLSLKGSIYGFCFEYLHFQHYFSCSLGHYSVK